MDSTIEEMKLKDALIERPLTEPSDKLLVQQPSKKVYKSAPSAPDDDLWLEYGRKLITESAAAIRGAASSMITALAALQGIYLGILGFAKFIPEEIALWKKFLFVMPPLCWIIAMYFLIQVMKTEISKMYLDSPTDIRNQYEQWVKKKQHLLQTAFWWLFSGLAVATLLVVLRLKL